jgi:hypothetical protein
MPIRYEVDAARRLVVATADAVVTETDLRDYVTSVLAHPDIRPGFRELADLRGVTRIEIPASVIADGIPSAIKGLEPQLAETRTAIVASEENAEEVSRVYDLLGTVVPTTVRLFGNMDEARKWLGLAGESQRSERRVAPRSTMQIAVVCRIGVQNHPAEIINLSLSGVLLRCPTARPAIGVPVRIWWEPPGAEGTSELRGTVVRHAEGGFAVRFRMATPELLELLGDPF